MQRDKNIYLIGFMGAGKSSVSRAMAELSDLEEVDMDAVIVSQEGMSIPHIFEKQKQRY